MTNLLETPYFFKAAFPGRMYFSIMIYGHQVEKNPISKDEKYAITTNLINLYTPKGFTEKYKKTGRFIFLYSVDDPLTPAPLVIKNLDYHYYQSFL
jgi:hypothetical protein